MATYTDLGTQIKNNDTNAFIPKVDGNRDYETYKLWLQGKDEFGGDLGTGANTPDSIPEPTLTEVKATKISDLKSQANSILSQTDWYVIRNTETAVSVPSNITSFRDSVRSYTDTAETAINALTSVEEVNAYTFSFPTL